MAQSVRKTCFELAKGLRKGDVLFWKKYKFPNGTQRNKYMLILSNCINGKFYIYTLPTSRIGFYKNPHNKIDTVWLSANKVKQFSLDTVIDLKHTLPERASQIGEKLYDNTLKKMGRLPSDVIYYIDDVIKNAKTLSPKVKNLILGNNKEIGSSQDLNT